MRDTNVKDYMVSSAVPASTTPAQYRSSASVKYQEQSQSLILKQSPVVDIGPDDAVEVSIKSGAKNQNPYALTAKEILARINKELKDALPEGVKSLDPDDFTPEATANRIVAGVTAFFDAFARQNKQLKGDELVDAFIETVKRGVQKGYDEAYKILEGIGAFEVEGVREGVQQTKILVESKLDAFAAEKKTTG